MFVQPDKGHIQARMHIDQMLQFEVQENKHQNPETLAFFCEPLQEGQTETPED